MNGLYEAIKNHQSRRKLGTVFNVPILRMQHNLSKPHFHILSNINKLVAVPVLPTPVLPTRNNIDSSKVQKIVIRGY